MGQKDPFPAKTIEAFAGLFRKIPAMLSGNRAGSSTGGSGFRKPLGSGPETRILPTTPSTIVVTKSLISRIRLMAEPRRATANIRLQIAALGNVAELVAAVRSGRPRHGSSSRCKPAAEWRRLRRTSGELYQFSRGRLVVGRALIRIASTTATFLRESTMTGSEIDR